MIVVIGCSVGRTSKAEKGDYQKHHKGEERKGSQIQNEKSYKEQKNYQEHPLDPFGIVAVSNRHVAMEEVEGN